MIHPLRPAPDLLARLAEPVRLATLRASGLLDGASAPVLDRIARLAARMTGVPIALVSLVDDRGQHFAGLSGLGGWAGEGRGTPLSHSFCQHVVGNDQPLVVDDAATQPYLAANRAHTELGVVAYAGVPLRTADGQTLGALCAIDTAPLAWTDDQLAILEELAAAAMSEIALRVQKAQLEAQARELERLSMVAARIDDAVVITDAEQRIEWVNPAFTRLCGHTAEEAIGCRPGELLQGPGTDPEARALVRAAIRARQGVTAELLNYRKDGRPYWSEVRITPVLDERGTLRHFVGIERDVTARREAERHLRDLSAAIGAAGEGIAIVDVHDTITYVNGAFARMHGHASPADLVGRTWTSLGYPDAPRFAAGGDVAAVLGRQDSWSGRATGRRASGSPFPVELSITVLPLEGRVIVARDVTMQEALETERDAFEAELGRSERQFRSLIESAGNVVVGLDGDFTIIEWNREAAALYGIARDDALGRSFLDECIPPALHDTVRAGMRRVLGGETVSGVEGAATDPAGARRWLAWTVAPLPTEEGEPPRVIATAHDITARKQAERALRQQREYVRQVLDMVPSAIFGKDAAGRFTLANAAMGAAFGTTADQLIGRTNADFIGAEAAAYFDAQDRAVLETGEPFFMAEESLGEPPGEVRWFRTTKQRMTDPGSGEAHVVGVGTDITALRDAREQAAAANRAKSDFLARMSHELRTPLTAVIGFSSFLEKKLGTRDGVTELERTYLARIARNGRHLLGLINDVLDLSKIEAGRMEVSPVPTDVATLARDVVLQLEGQAKPGVVLRAELPACGLPPVLTDDVKLRQVVINLVGNALKFTERGSVTVAVLPRAGGAGVQAIEVRDTGIGIPADRQAAVFEAFEQAEAATTRRFGGTGLGLSISRTLCHLLDADLVLESEVGRGTTFRIAFRDGGARAA